MGGTGGQQCFFTKSAIAIKFLMNICAHAFEQIQGIPELLTINADTVICRLDITYIWGIEPAKHSLSNTIGSTCCLLTGPLAIVYMKVVFHPMNNVLFLSTKMINVIYNIICKQGYPCVFIPPEFDEAHDSHRALVNTRKRFQKVTKYRRPSIILF